MTFTLALLFLFQEPFSTEAQNAWKTREQAVEKLRTRADLVRRQAHIISAMNRQIGGLPAEKTPLNARVTAGFERDSWRVEHVVFESLPGFKVTANLYLPKQAGAPFPAVVGLAGHSDVGKAEPTYQHAWINLARRGFAVLAIDPVGQGERREYADTRLRAGVPEHTHAGLQCLLTGSTIARYMVWDAMRAIDYLLTRPEIDPRRIASAGNSGGGTQSALLSVYEPRLAASVVSCYQTRWRELWEKPGPQDAEQILPGFLSDGLDFADFLTARAPRPVLMTTAIRDYFPIAGGRATFAEISRLFSLAGAPDNAAYFEYDDSHGWSQPRREAMYRFLARHLQSKDDDGREPAATPEPVDLLRATPSGQLQTSLGSRTVFELNRARAEEMYARRAALSARGPAALRDLVRRSLNLSPTPVALRGVLEKRSAAGSGRQPAILEVVENDPKTSTTPATGAVVWTLGFGRPSRGEGGYSPDYQAAARAWLTGRSILAAQVEDILAALDQLAAQKPQSIELRARGAAVPAAFIAAALDLRVAKLTATALAPSWLEAARTRLHTLSPSVVVPGILAHFDFSDLTPLLANRHVLSR